MQNEHRLFRSLWVAAKRLRLDGEAAERGSTWRCAGAALCTYFALEGFLNDLGDRIAPEIWAKEREFFSRKPYRGTLGKLTYLAEISALDLQRDRRPDQTLRELERVRHELVHPRTLFAGDDVEFDPQGTPKLPEPDALKTIETDGFVARTMDDVLAIGDSLLAAAKAQFPAELYYYGGGSFEGAIAGASGWAPYQAPAS